MSWTGFEDRLVLSLDFQYSWWSLATDPTVSFTINARGEDLGTLGLDEAFDSPQPGEERKTNPALRNILVPRMGFEYRALSDLIRVRGGAYFRPTPVPDQTSGTNWLDANAYAVTGSVAVRPSDPFGFVANPISLEASVQVISLIERQVQKRSSDDPIGNYRFGGQVIEGALGFHYNF